MKVLVINGPNINFLGIREKHIYGNQTYADLESAVRSVGAQNGIRVELFQSNHEGAIVDAIQDAYGKFDGIVINPAAYTHTSVAILDALNAVALPAVEVHLSDLTQREPFRQTSFAGRACLRTIMGKGLSGYEEALLFLKAYLST